MINHLFTINNLLRQSLRFDLQIPADSLILQLKFFFQPDSNMNRLIFSITIMTLSLLACKQEHPDLKAAQVMFNEAKALKQTILTSKVEILNEAKMIDTRVRNEDKESVFAISEVYNHLDAVDKSLKEMAHSEKAVPGHEKDAPGAGILNPSMVPAQVLMIQKNYKDSLQFIKNDLDAAATLINALKTKVK